MGTKLIGSGPLYTNGNQIVDQAGIPVRLDSIGLQRLVTDAEMKKIAEQFNTVRVSWVNENIEADLTRMKAIVALAAKYGVKVVLVNHTNENGTGPQDNWGAQQVNGLWYSKNAGAYNATDNTDGGGNVGTVTHAKFVSDWERVANTFKGNNTVIGYDIRNEPLTDGRSGGAGWGVTWGSGDVATDIRLMYQEVGNKLQAIDNAKLIIAEGPQNYDGLFSGDGKAPWGDLTGVKYAPVTLNTPNKVVYSIHDYPKYVSNFEPYAGPERVALMNSSWGFLVSGNVAPVWIGEMGANFDGSYDGEVVAESQDWARTLFDYMNGKLGHLGGPTFVQGQEGVSGNWWVWGHLPGDQLVGVLDANGNYRTSQSVWYNQMDPGATTAGGGGTTSQPGVWVEASLGGMEYSVLLPDGYDPGQEYAVTLFLHYLGGAGEQPVQADGYFNTTAFRSAYPSIVVVPRLENSGEDNNWGGVSDDIHAGQDQAIAVLKKVMADYSTDHSRVYVTGDSMGGIGTHDMMYHYNAYTGDKGRLFAAGVSIDGTNYAHTTQELAQRLYGVPFWAIHGADDGEVSPAVDRALGQALAGGPDDFRLTIREGEGHGVWWHYREDPTGSDGKPVWDWMFAQSTGEVMNIFERNVVGEWIERHERLSMHNAPGEAAKFYAGHTAATATFAGAKVINCTDGETDVIVFSWGDRTVDVRGFNPQEDKIYVDKDLMPFRRYMEAAPTFGGDSTALMLNGGAGTGGGVHHSDMLLLRGVTGQGAEALNVRWV